MRGKALKAVYFLKFPKVSRNYTSSNSKGDKRKMTKEELEKENAELKGIKDIATLIRAK